MNNIPIKCNGQHFIHYGECSNQELRTVLEELEPSIWKKYDFRTLYIKDIDCYRIPLYWSKNSWLINTPLIIYRFTEFSHLFNWIEIFHNFLKEKSIDEGIVVKAFIANLLPHKSIAEHIDYGNMLKYIHRYHWIVSSDESVQIIIEKHPYHWQNTNIYELNNMRLHSVNNPSENDRIHFIMDILPIQYCTNITYIDVNNDKYKEYITQHYNFW